MLPLWITIIIIIAFMGGWYSHKWSKSSNNSEVKTVYRKNIDK